jgi:hypothetical protein
VELVKLVLEERQVAIHLGAIVVELLSELVYICVIPRLSAPPSRP